MRCASRTASGSTVPRCAPAGRSAPPRRRRRRRAPPSGAAPRPAPAPGGVPVGLRVAAVVVEAGVPLARLRRRRGVHLVEVADHRLHRSIQAVEVHAVHAGARRCGGKGLVPAAEPAEKLEHGGIPPHPGGEALEAGEGRLRIVVSSRPRPAAGAVGIGPVRLPDHAREPQLRDESLRDPGALAIDVVAAVRRLAEEHEARIASHPQERVVVALAAAQEVRRGADRVDELAVHSRA